MDYTKLVGVTLSAIFLSGCSNSTKIDQLFSDIQILNAKIDQISNDMNVMHSDVQIAKDNAISANQRLDQKESTSYHK